MRHLVKNYQQQKRDKEELDLPNITVDRLGQIRQDDKRGLLNASESYTVSSGFFDQVGHSTLMTQKKLGKFNRDRYKQPLLLKSDDSVAIEQAENQNAKIVSTPQSIKPITLSKLISQQPVAPKPLVTLKKTQTEVHDEVDYAMESDTKDRTMSQFTEGPKNAILCPSDLQKTFESLNFVD